jgi:transcriptional regulator with XRE-family HTH domain
METKPVRPSTPAPDDPDAAALAYNRQVGVLLRTIRKHRRLSLQEVEARTGQEFKASVLGAYERGERALSLPRLGRLAEFYDVEAGHLLPGSQVGAQVEGDASSRSRQLRIDVEQLARLDGDEMAMLARFVASVQQRRDDRAARYVVVRDADRVAIAAIVGVSVEELEARLELLELLVHD